MNDKHTRYQIKIQGHLSQSWQAWFDDLNIVLTPDGNTLLSGFIDQAALHGVVKKIRNLGLTLISINPQGETDHEHSESTQPQ